MKISLFRPHVIKALCGASEREIHTSGAPARQADLALIFGRSQSWVASAQLLAVDPMPRSWPGALLWAQRHGFEMRWTAALKIARSGVRSGVRNCARKFSSSTTQSEG